MAKKITYYVPGKNKNKRKHYWWRYLLVFILGQSMVLPSFVLALGTAAASVEIGTVLELAKQDPDQYLTEQSKKMTILDLALYFANPDHAPKSLNDLEQVFKAKGLIEQLAQGDNMSFLSALLTDEFYATEFSKMGDYFTNSIEIGPVLESFNLPIPSLVTDMLYNTPVAYFAKEVDGNIKAVKGDVIDLSSADFTVLPAVASKSGFKLTATDEGQNSLTLKDSSITVASEATNGLVELTATPDDDSNDTVLPITFNVEIVNSLQCSQVTPYYDRANQIIIWKNVDHAKSYNVEYDAKLSIPATDKMENVIDLSKLSLTDGEEYEFVITTVGKDDNHTNSSPLTYSFTYASSQPGSQDPEGSGGETKANKREGGSEPETNTHVDEKTTYVDGNGNPVTLNHPNGYYDDDETLIRNGLTINGLTSVFSDITGIFENKTIGDLMGLFSGGGSGETTNKQPSVPVINKIVEATDIMEVFNNIKISEIMGGGIMGALEGIKLGILIKESDNDLMNSLREYTFGQLMNGEVDIVGTAMDTMLKGKAFKDLGFNFGDTGLLGIISGCCLVPGDDYPGNEDGVYYQNGKWLYVANDEETELSKSYTGPVYAMDMFNDLTIGQALGNENGDSGNAILDALSDIKLQDSDIASKMATKMQEKTVGELLGVTDPTGTAIVDALLGCNLSQDSITDGMTNLKLSAVIGGEDKMFKYTTENMTSVIYDQSSLDSYIYIYGNVYSDSDCTTPITSYDSLASYFIKAPELDGIWSMMFSDYETQELTFKDEAEFNEFIQYIDAFTDQDCEEYADTFVEDTIYYTNQLEGWQIAQRAKITDMGDLFTNVGTNMLSTPLNDLKTQGLLTDVGDLNGTLTFTIEIDLDEQTGNVGSFGKKDVTVSLDKNGYVQIEKDVVYDGTTYAAYCVNHNLYTYDGDAKEYKVVENKEASGYSLVTKYYREKTLGEYSLTDIINVLANMGKTDSEEGE